MVSRSPLRDRLIDTICLDAGGTLVWPNWGRVRDALAVEGITVDAASLAAADPRVRRSLDEGHLIAASTDQGRAWSFFDDVLTMAGVALTPQARRALSALEDYQRTMNLWEHVPDFVAPALVELRRRGYKLVVVSNANGTVKQAFRRIGLLDLVDVIVDSAEAGYEKPDRRLFDTALRMAGAQHARAIHVGDIYHIDVIGARAAGLTPVLVDEADLYGDADCHRIRSIAELPALLKDHLFVPDN
jgi:putative hydrolase of the HAD superfamily